MRLDLHLGSTGTSRGMTPDQLEAVQQVIQGWPAAITLHHGDCIGADKQLHQLARRYGWRVVGHLPINQKKRAFCDFDEIREPKPYLDRNQDIVHESAYLLATPKEDDEDLRSGTWATVRRARDRRRPILLVTPHVRVLGLILERWPATGPLVLPRDLQL